ncbi:SDR family oxidoreductase [uncultured Sulfitobacter sp.]|uniref:SDR family NAD(P)-dependent oxidoreductase n=1 Tax=uncultured Sulfitobacter sp. TaxID=191468 RepID=UPI0026047424|nr:SDR family oxidoreductase [uncultured Sulfitobacter sp.]
MNTEFHDLKGKSVFITGGASGIGATLTDGFMAQGARVAFVDIANVEEATDALQAKHGTRPLGMHCDVSDVDALQSAISRADTAHGPVQILVNNAADDVRHATDAVSPQMWDENTGINLKPYFFACQAVLKGMQAQGGGTIINFSSVSYIMGNAGYPLYVMANGGITAMTRSLAREFGPDGIRVNALAPGWVKTPKQLSAHGLGDPAIRQEHLDKQCLKRVIEPEDILGPVLFLASDCSKMMTGQLMAVDGGVVVTG